MTSQMPFELTDALVERMLAEQAGQGAPLGLVSQIAAEVEATPQLSAGILSRIGWPETSRMRSVWVIVGVAILVALTIGAVLIGSTWLERRSPLGDGPLIVYKLRGTFADIYAIDVANGQQTALGSVQFTSQIGGQRIRWAADGRHAFVFSDPDHVQAQVDVAAHTVNALHLLSPDGQTDEVSPAGDRVARVIERHKRRWASQSSTSRGPSWFISSFRRASKRTRRSVGHRMDRRSSSAAVPHATRRRSRRRPTTSTSSWFRSTADPCVNSPMTRRRSLRWVRPSPTTVRRSSTQPGRAIRRAREGSPRWSSPTVGLRSSRTLGRTRRPRGRPTTDGSPSHVRALAAGSTSWIGTANR